MSFYLESRDREQCFNCTACATVCPKKCIIMEVNPDDGYIYPKIDKTKCINCGKCKLVCINLNHKKLQSDIKKAYVLYNKNENVRMKSSSGGISHILMQYVIQNDGVVYGAGYNDKLIVVHSRAETIKECDKFKTSKYVRSDIRDIYIKVIEDLKNDKLVLFTGTPCQIAGIKSVVNKNLQKKLILCEIMCDCVASPILFEKFKDEIEKKYNSKIENINFRSKTNGAHNKSMEIKLKDRTVILPQNSNNLYSEYMQIFGCGLSTPISCTKCEFEHVNERISDFTIGDYWGKKEIIPDDNKGISMLLLNTEKAIDIFEQYIKDNVNYIEVQPTVALDNNHIKHKNIILNKESFMEDLSKLSFDQLAKKYVRKYRWRTKLGKIIPKSLKEKIKEIINKR